MKNTTKGIVRVLKTIHLGSKFFLDCIMPKMEFLHNLEYNRNMEKNVIRFLSSMTVLVINCDTIRQFHVTQVTFLV